jgi:hypothetical protein
VRDIEAYPSWLAVLLQHRNQLLGLIRGDLSVASVLEVQDGHFTGFGEHAMLSLAALLVEPEELGDPASVGNTHIPWV